MTKTLLFLGMYFLVAWNAAAQTTGKSKSDQKATDVLMEPKYWEFDSSKVEFVSHRSVKAVRGKKNAFYQIFLKDTQFTNGTIEFDVELNGSGFPGINFRMAPDKKNGENFYIRSFGPVSVETRTTLQYAPILDGVSMWDLFDEYQTGATIHQQGWNHVKLVISGKQMKVYVNDMEKHALHVPYLESAVLTGGISLSGNVIYANLRIDKSTPKELSPEPAYNPFEADTRYLRNWRVNGPVDFPFGRDLVFPLPSMYGVVKKTEIPDSTAIWTKISADRKAMINLSGVFGGVENDGRRIAWLKTTLSSDKAQRKLLKLGFSDEVWFFVNGEIVHVDKNYFGTPNAKDEGRCLLDNASIYLPLKEGKNEILVALANYFYGWGLIARFENTDGIHF